MIFSPCSLIRFTMADDRGHTSFVTCAVYLAEGSNIMTSSFDGTCRVWDTKTCEALVSFRPDSTSAHSLIHETPLLNIFLVPNTPDYVIICSKNRQAFMVTAQGQHIQQYSASAITADFLSFTLSSHGKVFCGSYITSVADCMITVGKYLYCGTADGKIVVFNIADGTIEETLTIDDREIIGIFHHPQRNMLGTMTDHGLLKIWKA